MINAQAGPAFPATPALTLVGPTAESKAQSALKRFQSTIQDLLDTPLDAAGVLEWTRLRAAASHAER